MLAQAIQAVVGGGDLAVLWPVVALEFFDQGGLAVFSARTRLLYGE